MVVISLALADHSDIPILEGTQAAAFVQYHAMINCNLLFNKYIH